MAGPWYFHFFFLRDLHPPLSCTPKIPWRADSFPFLLVTVTTREVFGGQQLCSQSVFILSLISQASHEWLVIYFGLASVNVFWRTFCHVYHFEKRIVWQRTLAVGEHVWCPSALQAKYKKGGITQARENAPFPFLITFSNWKRCFYYYFISFCCSTNISWNYLDSVFFLPVCNSGTQLLFYMSPNIAPWPGFIVNTAFRIWN